jgi:O-antigen/teichoic acid export membrane protein
MLNFKKDILDSFSKVSIFVSTSTFSAVVLAIQGIVVIKIMPPELMGIWLALQLIHTFGIQFHFGILNAVNRQIPYYLGKKDEASSLQIENVARGNLIVLTLVGVLGFVVVYQFELFDRITNVGVLAIGMSTIVSLNMQFYIGIFKARNQFNKAAIVSILEAVTMLIGLPLIYFFLLEGLFLRSIITSLILLFACLWLHKWYFKIEFKKEITVELLRIGIPIMILGYGLVLLHSMDRLLILTFLDNEAMGYYALSLSVYSFVGLLPTLIGQVYYPKMMKHYAEFGMSDSLIKDCFVASAISVTVTGVVVIILLLLLPWVVSEYFASYTEGVPAMKISLLGVFILAFIAGPTYFLIVTNQKRKQGVMLSLSLIIMYFLGSELAVYGLIGIAWSLVVAFLIYIIGLWLIVLQSQRKEKNTSAQC